jgi:hypothetical protein
MRCDGMPDNAPRTLVAAKDALSAEFRALRERERYLEALIKAESEPVYGEAYGANAGLTWADLSLRDVRARMNAMYEGARAVLLLCRSEEP